ncbi:hydroxymethylglutaryl-CoA synthase [Streptococcus ruminantium]|uniref:Hydroxymethylglutaryl-CoA synthase n=1 Tax=Streptococcus ruminantium TaxID=1917441 RepID=A0ABU1B1A0_9STRE|nr:hydroxymethylglutaryl-CoA synthase [Streptococcus ruminantium]MDQ8759524.1 hydroxymethylglutaryl-CoA synthase [Streptococcus ruminantium]MDQ8768467.1 hydroxymethylglutaryl-CoA synthase [Streptococcus ruminantium]MDQ8774341.1 hydroxymethylglutaryl-CoA synthase [Streptococcus ruminantium]MDQ8793251.1 hydroxymethylglutaryl-CoA synthase [Streptococcus ruminantium]MDQ8796152.1 hydroxymethylglutaryl-CoA synthase [Streptococcus ruminantium]
MNIGIDKIGFAAPDYVLDLADLALARNIDPNKFKIGLLQSEMAVAPITQDIVTLGAQAAEAILTEEDKKTIDMVIVGTESSVDQSKAAAVSIHNLLGIQPFARSIEMKEACYGATAGLSLAKSHIAQFPKSKVLVIASDIAKYGIASGGEPTQGAGAVAMLVTANPRILVLNNDNVCQTRDIYDFWRPNYDKYPRVDGKFSTEQYTDCLTTTFDYYQQKTSKKLKDFAAMCLHIPFSKQGLKGLQAIAQDQETLTNLTERFQEAIVYNKIVGNIYTGSIFLSLLSLLENSRVLKAEDQILFYSYGSGAVCEIFSGYLVEGYLNQLEQDRLHRLNQRTKLSVEEYENIFFEELSLDETGTSSDLPVDHSTFALIKVDKHKRIYRKN